MKHLWFHFLGEKEKKGCGASERGEKDGCRGRLAVLVALIPLTALGPVPAPLVLGCICTTAVPRFYFLSYRG